MNHNDAEFSDQNVATRATKILRSVEEILKKRGYRQSHSEEMWRRGNRFEVHGCYYRFSVREQTARRRDSTGKPIEPPQLDKTGVLELKMEGNSYSDSWCDGKRKLLEHRLEDIVTDIETKSVRFETVQREMEDSERNKVRERLERIRRETDIECVVRLWPGLPDNVKRGIVAMVRATAGEHESRV